MIPNTFATDVVIEGNDATFNRSGSRPFVSGRKGKPGRKREARSMGRYPFMMTVNEYLDSMQSVLKATTWKEYDRRYRRMHRDLLALHEAGKVENVNPKKINEKDILMYLQSLRARGMRDSGVAHNVDALAALLRYVGNGVLEKARLRSPQHFPKYARSRLDPIGDDDRKAIIGAAEGVPNGDFRRMVAYGFAVAGICTGLRPGELRMARLNDLDLKRGTLHAEEVKGKDRYGEPRNAAIHPDGLPFLKRYLRARAKAIAEKAPKKDFLFPALRDIDGDGCYSQQGLSELRKLIRKETGIEFDGRACRRTYGQQAIDQGVPLDAVSRMLGHKTTKTTETYYCRRTNDSAIAVAQQVWGNKPDERPSKPGNSPLIEKKEYLSGYA